MSSALWQADALKLRAQGDWCASQGDWRGAYRSYGMATEHLLKSIYLRNHQCASMPAAMRTAASHDITFVALAAGLGQDIAGLTGARRSYWLTVRDYDQGKRYPEPAVSLVGGKGLEARVVQPYEWDMAMAVEPLNRELQSAGFAMRDQLDAVGLRPQGLMWLHFPHVRDWRLTVISDLLSELGRTRIYALLGEALDKVGPVEGLTIFDLHLSAPDEIVTSAIQGAFNIELGSSLQAIPLIDCTAEGQPVDALVYRMLAARHPAEVRAAAREFQTAAKAFIQAH